jgi:hypothetical protein
MRQRKNERLFYRPTRQILHYTRKFMTAYIFLDLPKYFFENAPKKRQQRNKNQ